MDPLAISGIILLIMFGLLANGVWIFISLALSGLITMYFFSPVDVGQLLARSAWNATNVYTVTCVPLFIFMGELFFHSRISKQLFDGLAPWVLRIPGRLYHSNIIACSIFAAVSGSSTATCATIGTVFYPELKARGYDDKILVGSLAGAGTLGLMIPPSIVMIIYGVCVGESIGKLYMGGVIPGLMLAAIFMLYIAITVTRHPELAPEENIQYTWKEKMKLTAGVIPMFLSILIVLGGLYLGWTTPTEAGAIGALCAFVLTIINKAMTWKVIRDSLMETVRITCMVLLIYQCAFTLSAAVSYLRVPTELANLIVSLSINRYVIFIGVVVLYLILGCFFDGISMLVITMPVIYPIMMKLGFDSLWFGIQLVVLIEIAQITPPVGFNLYVMQGISGRSIQWISMASLPFFFLMILGIVILTIFPSLATWLPNLMIGK